MKMNGDELTRRDAFRILFDLEKHGISIDPLLKDMSLNSCGVPDSVKEFIYAYQNYPVFIEKLKTKQFYKNILKDDLSILDKAKALSSLITHTLIECGTTNNKNQMFYLSESIKLKDILSALHSFMIQRDSTGIEQVTEELRELFNSVNANN